jgi:lipoprotein-anchoring transpeptidase ErfK/SrfK
MKKAAIFLILALFSTKVFAGQVPVISTKVTLELDGKKSVEEAVFETSYVVNPDLLKALVLEVKTEVENLAEVRGRVSVNLNIPANYLVEAMTMYEEVDLTTNTLVLYQLYDEEKIELIQFKVATGRGQRTPTGEYCLKRITHLPYYYTPKEWGERTGTVKPGLRNPYGLWYSEVLKISSEPVGYEFRPNGAISKNGVGQHSTNRPRSIGRYASHGCIRVHPKVAERLFPFLLRFTPHKKPKSGARGKEIYPFSKGYLIYVKIYRSKKE